VTNGGRAILNTARKNLERDKNLLIECVHGQGVKVTEERVGILCGARKRIGKVCRKAMKRVVNSMTNKELPNEERVTVNTQLSLLGAIGMFTAPKAERVIEGQVKANEAKELSTLETLKLFGK
jgi:hypothetical protein